ncbi:MAG: hypothetical protein ABI697_07555 [Devosia sp.]
MSTTRLLVACAAFAALTSAAGAADLLKPADPIYSSQLFNFEGLYVGGQAGIGFSGTSAGVVGVVVGSNFALTDGIVAGVEFQADGYFNGGITAYDALALGRIGGFLSDNTMIYGELGAGFANSGAVYAIGGGVETALTDKLSVRGELQGLGSFGSSPSLGKATVGLMWHMN